MRAAYPELPQFAVTNLAPGVATTFATCCHPVPGDRIAGVRTSGRTVVIHRQDCRTLQSVKVPLENLLDLDWDSTLLRFGAAGSLVSFTGRISVVADDDPGTLAALTDAVAKHDGLISGVKVVSRDKDTVAILMDTGVRDLPHLFKIIGGLRAAPGTRSVERVQG
jgi:GTP pyrophosphokinase